MPAIANALELNFSKIQEIEIILACMHMRMFAHIHTHIHKHALSINRMQKKKMNNQENFPSLFA